MIGYQLEKAGEMEKVWIVKKETEGAGQLLFTTKLTVPDHFLEIRICRILDTLEIMLLFMQNIPCFLSRYMIQNVKNTLVFCPRALRFKKVPMINSVGSQNYCQAMLSYCCFIYPLHYVVRQWLGSSWQIGGVRRRKY